MRRPLILLALAMLLFLPGCSAIERHFLFHPSHRAETNGLTPWVVNGETIGYARIVAAPHTVWLMLHGNGGQAADRTYALPSFSDEDSVYIMEYPGYGARPGVPSRKSFDAAAVQAYAALREAFPNKPVCVAAESLGTGPACFLGSLPHPPDKLVLIAAFDRLSLVAKDHFPSVLVKLMMSDDWDNIKALAHYKGPVEVYGAEDDTIIPVEHARALAVAIPSARFILMEGGHNDWAAPGRVWIR